MATSLPYEIFVTIITYLPINDVVQINLVCKSWHRHVLHPSFWCNLVKNKYPDLESSEAEKRLCLHLLCLNPDAKHDDILTSQYLSFLRHQELQAHHDKKPFKRFLVHPIAYYPCEFGYREHLKGLLVSAYTQAGALLKIHYYLPPSEVDFYTSLVKRAVEHNPKNINLTQQQLHQRILTLYLEIKTFRSVRKECH